MSNKRISELTSASTLTLGDLFVLVNESQTRKTTLGNLLSFLADQDQFAQLDETGTIPASQLPESIIGSMRYEGSWNPSTNTPAIAPASAANKGLYYVASTDGTQVVDGISDWRTGDWIVSNGNMWQKIDNAAVLTRVLQGFTPQTGAITATDSVITAFGKTQGQLNGKESTANKGAASGYASLDASSRLTPAQTPLVGTMTLTNSPVVAADTLLAAFGKTQAQLNTKGAANGLASLDANSRLTPSQTPLVGTMTLINSSVVATDTLLAAFGKTQAQLNTKGAANGLASLDASSRLTPSQTPLVGTLTLTNSPILATDTLLAAFGKTQAQLNTKAAANGLASLDANSRLTPSQTPLVGTMTLTNSPVLATDTLLTAFGKTQAQLNTKAAANGLASLDANSKLPKAQLTRGTGTFNLDFLTYTAGITSTALYGYFIPAGTLGSGDQLNLDVWLSSTGGPNSIQVYFSTSFTAGSAPTGTLVATCALSAFPSAKFKREFSFLSNTGVKSGVAPATASFDGISTTTADTVNTIPSVSAGFWVVIAGFRSPSSSSLKIERVALTGLFQ